MTVRFFAYRAKFEEGDRPGTFVVTFPDVPEAITEGRGLAEARAMASDALGLVLLAYVRAGRPLPRTQKGGHEAITVPPDVAAKLAVLSAFEDSGMTQRELARRLGKDEKEIRRILDPMHATRLSTLSDVLRELGRRLVVGVETVSDAA